MKAFIVQFPYGVAAFDDKNQLVEKALFPKKAQAAAKSLLRSETGKLPEQATSLITLLKTAGYDVFVFTDGKLAEDAQRKMEITVEVAKPAESAVLNSRMAEVAVESGFVADQAELDVWNRNVSTELSKLRIKGATGKRDLIVAQGIQTLDSLDQTVNLFMGRLREWYGVYFPELDRLVEKHETYSRLVVNLGSRESFTVENLEAENIPKERTQLVAKAAESSMGADMAERDLEQVQMLAKDVSAFYELRKSMEDYVDSTMEEMAPNIRAVAGALLGARMISMAGGLQNLAMRPASTIQVLGAEKALFRSLKTGARPPKHGLIFQHTLLHDAKRWQRGKIARAIAGKLAIAARADAFGQGHFIGDELKADINKRIDEIREKYKEPPPPKEAKPRAPREGGFERRGGGERRFGGGREQRREGGGRRFEGRESEGEESEQRFQYREPPREGQRPPFQPKPKREEPPRETPEQRPQFQQKPRREEPLREDQGERPQFRQQPRREGPPRDNQAPPRRSFQQPPRREEPPREGQAPPQRSFQEAPRQEGPPREGQQQRPFTPKPRRDGPPKGGKRRRKQWRDRRGPSS